MPLRIFHACFIFIFDDAYADYSLMPLDKWYTSFATPLLMPPPHAAADAAFLLFRHAILMR